MNRLLHILVLALVLVGCDYEGATEAIQRYHMESGRNTGAASLSGMTITIHEYLVDNDTTYVLATYTAHISQTNLPGGPTSGHEEAQLWYVMAEEHDRLEVIRIRDPEKFKPN